MAISINHSTNAITSDTGGYVNISSNVSFKNRIINGAMTVAQRGTAAQTVTAGNTVPTVSTGYYLDRWFTYCLDGNVTVGTTVVAPYTTAVITGAAGVTSVGFGQRIESWNCMDLGGGSVKVTLSFIMANTLLTTASLSLWYANTQDTFGTIASPTKTQIGSTSSIPLTSTLSSFKATYTLPTTSYLGLEVLFTAGAQTSGTWSISNVQLERGTTNTPFDIRPYGYEMELCQRYMELVGSTAWRTSGYNTVASATNNYGQIPMLTQKRGSPTLVGSYTGTAGVSMLPANGTTWNNTMLSYAITSPATANTFWIYYNSTILTINAEL